MKTIIEPFRIKSVEPLRMTTAVERRRHLRQAGYNLFRIPSRYVIIDLLTDSGTGAMSSEQWAGVMRGDESYAGAESYWRFLSVVKQLTGFRNVLPTHQGRASERILFEVMIGSPPAGRNRIVPGNAHFDTTRANIEHSGAEAVDLLTEAGRSPLQVAPFKGNIDTDRLDALLAERGDDVPLVMVTVTCNNNGGQPVSLENLRAVRALCDRYGKPMFLDAARFAENAWFIKHKEPGFADRSIVSIVHEMFEQVDGFHISFKKDGLVNIGGAVYLNQGGLFQEQYPHFSEMLVDRQILTEGHPTYGGLAGRDLKALAEGLKTVVRDEYLDARIHQVGRFGSKLLSYGIPIKEPVGGHAVYLDMDRFFEGTDARDDEFRGIAFTALLLFGGHRLCELGIYAFGAYKNGKEIAPDPRVNNVRASVPRLSYEDQDLFALCETIRVLHENRDRIPAIEVVHGRDLNLRHFKSRFRFR
jgi:tyrosine phenol-lyase